MKRKILTALAILLIPTVALAAVIVNGRSEPEQTTLENTISTNEHVHSYEHWFGVAVSPSGEVDVADAAGVTTSPLQLDGGNDTFGSWVQIVGSSDTPHVAGKSTYQIHEILIESVERTTATHLIQIGFGSSAAAALSSNNVLEVMYKPSAASTRAAPIVIQSEGANVGTKAWARVYVFAQNTGTVDFYFGLHEGSI